MTVSRFLWGTGYENQVNFAFSLFDVLTDRPPREGSELVQIGSGSTDAWITGRDYVMTTEVRWIPQIGAQQISSETFMSGSRSVQEFLDWARDGNDFRFVPDVTYGDFYVPSCYLVEPFRGAGRQTSNLKRAYTLTIRNASYDFLTALRGLMIEYKAGGLYSDDWTFSRTGVAFYHDIDGNADEEATGILRDRHFIGSTHTTLIEATRENLVTESEDISGWSTSGTPVVTDDSLTLGDLNLALVEDDDGAAAEFVHITPSFTGDAAKAISAYVKEGPNQTAGSLLRLRDTDAAADRLSMLIEYTAGVPNVTETTGALLDTKAIGNGIYRLLFRTTSVTAANTNRIEFYPAGGGAANTGDAYFGGVQAEDALTPSSYIHADGATATRAAERFTRSFIWKPQAMWVYAKFIELGTNDTAYLRLVQIGNSNPIVRLESKPSNRYGFLHDNGDGSSVTSNAAVGSSIGDTVELLGLLYADGSVQLKQSINGGAETDGGQSGANALGSAFGTTTMALNSTPDGSKVGLTGFEHLKIGAGVAVNTIALARAA